MNPHATTGRTAAHRDNPSAAPSSRRLALAALTAALALLPLALPLSPFAFGLLAQLGASYVLLRGVGWLYARAGLLTFGQATFAGLGGYAAAHAMNAVAAQGWPLPFALVPLYGAAFAFVFALLLGPLLVRRGGLSFAMISLGLCELLAQAAPMLQGFFGGEGGVWTDRSAAPLLFALRLDSERSVYALTVVYALLAAALLARLDASRWGLRLAAMRDNPLRVAMCGLSPRRLRLQALAVAAALGGLSGALQTVHLEQVSASALSLAASSQAVLFALAGGAASGWGALLGAALQVLGGQWLVQWTQGWLLDVALVFLAVVLWAPQGAPPVLAALLARRNGPMALRAALLLGGLTAAVSLAGLVQLGYTLRQQLSSDGAMQWLGMRLHAEALASWALLAAVAAAGALLAAWAGRRLRRACAEAPP